jgi:hypothetical protein
VLEEIEGLRLEPHDLAPTPQLAPVRVKSIVFEQKTHSQFRRGVAASAFKLTRLRAPKKQAGGKEKEALLKVQTPPGGYF